MPSFSEHFDEHAASALARQIALGDLLGERPWGIDTQTGMIRFGDDLTFPIQMLGTHGFDAGTWMWIWANTQSGIPAQHTQAALQIRQLGEADAIAEFTEPVQPMDNVTDHMIAMTCGGLLDGRCYYRAPYAGGALFVLLDDVPPEVTRAVPVERAITVLMQLVSDFDVKNPRRMAESFLRQQAFALTSPSATQLIAERPGEGRLEVSFDDRGRIANVSGTLNARPTEAAKAPRWQFWKR